MNIKKNKDDIHNDAQSEPLYIALKNIKKAQTRRCASLFFR